jgi:DNA-binding GntR family transcriptional regulator
VQSVCSVIAHSTGVADTVEQKRLNLAAGDPVVRVTRIRTDGDRSRCYEIVVLPLAPFPDVSADAIAKDGLCSIARQRGLALGRAIETLHTVYVTTDVAEQLGIDPDEPVFKLDRLVRTASGLPVEWRTSFVAVF